MTPTQRPACEEELEEDEDHRTTDDLTIKLLKTRTILLSGEINKRSAESVNKQLLLLEAESDQDINLFIDSPGGDPDAGYAIYDMVKFVVPRVRTICMGLTASAAITVLLAADKTDRYAFPNAHILIHQPLGAVRGVASDIAIHAQEIEKLRQRTSELIAEETGQPLEKVIEDTDRDYWMTAEEALKYGLVGKILRKRVDL